MITTRYGLTIKKIVGYNADLAVAHYNSVWNYEEFPTLAWKHQGDHVQNKYRDVAKVCLSAMGLGGASK